MNKMAEEQKISLTGNQLAQLANQERQKLAEINRRISAFQGFRTELMGARDALEEIGRNEKGEKILVNLGGGIFMQAALEENSKALSTIAGNIFREKSGKELVKELEKKIQNLGNTLESAGEEQQKTIARLTQLEQIMSAGQDYVRKAKAQQ